MLALPSPYSATQIFCTQSQQCCGQKITIDPVCGQWVWDGVAYVRRSTREEATIAARHILEACMASRGASEMAQSLHARDIAAIRPLLTARGVLRDAAMRSAVVAGTPRDRILSWASPEVVREAIAIMASRADRRAARLVSEQASAGQPGRMLAMQTARDSARKNDLALEIARVCHSCRRLSKSQYASYHLGLVAEIRSGGRYGKKWHQSYGPAKCMEAGTRVIGDDVAVSDSTGRMVLRVRISRRDYRARDLSASARRLCRMIDRSALDALGEHDDEDRASIARPSLVCRSKSGWIIADHPGTPTYAQVVVTDSTTGKRHHLGVPPQFGRPLAKNEKAADRVRAAIAWTFGREAKRYQPQIEA